MDNKIIVIGHSFGRTPNWIDIYLKTCELNKAIHWLFIMDDPPSGKYGNNIKFIRMSLKELRQLVLSKTGIEPPEINGYKVCDFRPAFGLLFEEHLKGYGFWGHADFDIIWGDIGKFINDDILNNYDVVSGSPYTIAGHFTLYRNTPFINNLYLQSPYYKDIFGSSKFYGFDEIGRFMETGYGIAKILRDLERSGKLKALYRQLYVPDQIDTDYLSIIEKVYGEKVAAGPLSSNGNGYWRDGKVFSKKYNSEFMYLHFCGFKFTPYFAPLPMHWNSRIISFEVRKEGFIFFYSNIVDNLLEDLRLLSIGCLRSAKAIISKFKCVPHSP